MMKSNYKKTVLGWIPKDWNLCKFADIPDQKIKWSLTGGPFGSDLKSSDYIDADGVRIIQLQNIGDGKFLDSYKIFTSKKKADELIGCNIYPGELIMSKMGDPVTRTCIIPDFHERYLMASDGIRLVPDNTKFDSKFVLEYINFNIFRKIAVANSTGSTRQRIGLGDLKKLPFICPPLPEQQKIATILCTWDKSIEKLTQLIATKEQRKKGLMQLLLTGKKRLAGFMEEWKVVMLGDCSVIKGDYGINAPGVEFRSDLPKYLRITDIDDSGQLRLESMVSVNSDESHRYILEDQDIVFARTGASVGKNYVHDQAKYGSLVFAGFLIRFRLDQKILLSHFLRAFLTTADYWNWIKIMSQRSGQPGINGKEYCTLKVPVPTIDEQQKIASILSAADREIELLKQELSNLQQQKKGLMQKLLTGEVRVKIN